MKFFFQKISLGLLGFVILVCAACTNNDKKLFAECYVRYEVEEQNLLCEAKFKEGKDWATALPKTMPDIFFDDGAMQKRNNAVKGLYYTAEKNDAYKPNYILRLPQENGKAYTLSLESVEAMPVFGVKTTNKMSKTNGFTLFWEGTPLRKNERLTLLITDQKGEVASTIIAGATATTEKNIPGTLFSGLQNGPATLKLVRQKLDEKEENDVSMKTIFEYYTKEQAVEIVLN